MKITVIGESNIDIAVISQPKNFHGGCTPGRISFHHGGVARNIAHNLCLLEHEVKLVSVFGDDGFAKSMIEECEQLGIDLSLSSQYTDAKSPVFLSFNDEVGNMQSAISDIKLNGCLELDWIIERIDAVNRSDMVVADTLLSVEALTFLIDHCLVPLYIDTVSPKRALLLAEAIKKSWKKSISALKCNLAEAQSMTGAEIPQEAARVLNTIGIEEVFLTMGEEGVCYSSKKDFRHFQAIEVEAVNVTGSGDAFFAGIIHAHATGHKGTNAVDYGLKAACHNAKSEALVNPTLRISVFND